MASPDELPFVEELEEESIASLDNHGYFLSSHEEELFAGASQLTSTSPTAEPTSTLLLLPAANIMNDENPRRTKKPRPANSVAHEDFIETNKKQSVCGASSSARIDSHMMMASQSTDATISTSSTTMSFVLGTGEATKTTTSWIALAEDENMVRAILGFVGPGHFRFVAGTNRQFRKVYKKILLERGGRGNSGTNTNANASTRTRTTLHSAVESISRLKIYLKEDTTDSTHQSTRNRRICSTAAAGGHLEVLKWARENGCDWNTNTCSNAAAKGHLEVIKWARENGCDWNARTCFSAAGNGHLKVLQWARNNGCNWDFTTCCSAALNGHLEVLKWARENGCDWNHQTCSNAAINGHLEVLQWTRQNGCTWNAQTSVCAAGGGHLEVLQWALQNGCAWNAWTCSNAAANGHLNVLKWARENGCDWAARTCSDAAKNGHLEVLQWARENGCDWNATIYADAGERGHLDVIQWARENGCPERY